MTVGVSDGLVVRARIDTQSCTRTRTRRQAPVPLAVRLPDPDDEPFLEVAVAARAEYLVTGNGDHFTPDRRAGVRVVSPREFIDAERSRIGT
ncbi:MAG: PIN domain-containing protein [Spirochaetaceae bacterium]|nr:PIN domain-containing protein [Spirochaetaceae bacterium]